MHFRAEDQPECVGIRRESLLCICHDELTLRNLYCFVDPAGQSKLSES